MFTHSEYKIDIIKENQTNKNEEIILYMYIDVAIIEKLNYNKKKKRRSKLNKENGQYGDELHRNR